MLEQAPLYSDIACGPQDGAAYWIKASDGVRLRIGVWGAGTEGTVVLFPGRTEYIEKYGLTAADLCAAGYRVAVVDWRGQGLADRLIDNAKLGHVTRFRDYQLDVAAVMGALRQLDLPRPFHLIAHSMGGAIGLRALMEGLDVASAVFSAPMWGISLDPVRRPAAWVVTGLAGVLGVAVKLAPGTREDSYVIANPFDGNLLTTDREMFDYMREQIEAYPELGLGGPTMTWLGEALRDCRAMQMRPTPQVPALTLLGDREKIVDVPAIRDRMARWPNGQLHVIEGGEHEVLMEDAEIRARCTELMLAHFQNAPEARGSLSA